MVEIGGLYPLTKAGEVDPSLRALPILQGANVLGRNDSSLFCKKVSRKHISINASPSGDLEITVEGPNPVVLQSGGRRKKLIPMSKEVLKDGDVIEFVPMELPFKYIAKIPAILPKCTVLTTSKRNAVAAVSNCSVAATLSSKSDVVQISNGTVAATSSLKCDVVAISDSSVAAPTLPLDGGEMCTESFSKAFLKEAELLRSRKRQLEADEAFARRLQDDEDRAAGDEFNSRLPNSSPPEGTDALNSLRSKGSDTEHKRAKGEYRGGSGASTFRLMHTEALPRWVNAECVRIGDVIHGDIQAAILSNYMVDLTWLLSACPLLYTIRQVVMIHGESSPSMELLQVSKPNNWILFKPPLRLSYGTHHSKAMLLIYPTGVRVIVHTANLIYVDWNNKTQGLWMQDFPLKDSGHKGKSAFEDDLVEYLEALEWPGCTVHFPNLGETRLNAKFFRRFDYSSASVRLVASVPGYHRGQSVSKWGHMKLRAILQEQQFEEQFKGSGLVYQFSSLGSLDEKWISELTASMSSGFTTGKKSLGLGEVRIVWPTVEDIRVSLEGYSAGSAVPSPHKNVQKEFLKKYWARWNADHVGRSRAIPHMKSYVRYNGQSLAWFLLTSSNLSKAAWGALQKNNTQIMIRSFELGVLFLPSLVLKSTEQVFSCTDSFYSLTRGGLSKSLPPQVNNNIERHNLQAKLLVSCRKEDGGEDSSVTVVQLPVPYKLPPSPYGPQDVPWSWDCQYRQPDVHGECWPR